MAVAEESETIEFRDGLTRAFDTVENWGEDFYSILPNMIVGFVVLFIFGLMAYSVSRTIRLYFERKERIDLGNILSDFGFWAMMLAGCLISLTIIMPSLRPADLLASLGIGSIAIGFAFKDILQNWLSGLLILLRLPFRRGDQIIIGEAEGTVMRIDPRATILRTYDGRDIVVPNSTVYSNNVTINTSEPQRRVELDLTVGYNYDIRVITRILKNSLDQVEEILKETKVNIDFIGFHGQTIYHNAKEKISKQLGDGKLLSQLTKKTVIYDFRQNDLKNGGHGAPLSPIFHKLLKEKFKIKKACFVNLGGIINTTSILDNSFFSGYDIGPGMCLIDQWIRHNSEKKYDEGGKIAKSGKVNKIVLKKLIESLNQKEEELLTTSPYVVSYDVKDFDLSFVKGLSLKDGAATLVQFTINTIYSSFKMSDRYEEEIILCGGGRKNKFLLERMKKYGNQYFKGRLKMIDEFNMTEMIASGILIVWNALPSSRSLVKRIAKIIRTDMAPTYINT